MASVELPCLSCGDIDCVCAPPPSRPRGWLAWLRYRYMSVRDSGAAAVIMRQD